VLSLGSCFVWLSLSKVREVRVYVIFKYFAYFWIALVSLVLECCCWSYENVWCVGMFG